MRQKDLFWGGGSILFLGVVSFGGVELPHPKKMLWPFNVKDTYLGSAVLEIFCCINADKHPVAFS